jgi:hypothetical protein
MFGFPSHDAPMTLTQTTLSRLRFTALAAFAATLLSACGGTTPDPVAAAAELKGIELVLNKGQSYPALKAVPTGLQSYTTTLSVAQGGVAKFHISDASGSTLKTRNAVANVYRMGLTEELISTASVATKKQTIPANAWKDCCNWPVSWQINVASTWKSGLYRADFALGSSLSSVYFVVKSATPGTASKSVLQIPFHTAQAYNNWGGKSLYEFNSSSSVKADRVSMYRPNVAMDGEVYRWILPFIQWAEKSNIALDYIASTDLDQANSPLGAYKLFMTVGHDEYWSTTMRGHYDSFVSGGGNAAIFSGNTMWWKTNNTADALGRAGGLMIATKVAGSTTGNWYESNPEGKSIGASFIRGGYVDEVANPAATKSGYQVVDATHWVFTGTGLAKGASFGQAQRILRYEVDGVDFNYDTQGVPRATGGDGVNVNTSILGLVALNGWAGNASALRPASAINLKGVAGPWAAMTLSKNNGWVFNGGTTDWARGLEPCVISGNTEPVCKITKNVIDTLSAAVSPPAPPVPPPTPVPTPTPTPTPVDPEVVSVLSYSAPNSLGGLRYLYSVDPSLSGEWIKAGRAFFGLSVARTGTLPVLRYSYTQADGKKRYIFSTEINVGGGWTSEGTSFHAYSSLSGSTVAVYEHYRVLSDGWHFMYDLATTPQPGWTLSGYAFSVPASNLK